MANGNCLAPLRWIRSPPVPSPGRPTSASFATIGDVSGNVALESAIQYQIDRALTHAFSRSFLAAALLALAAAIPLVRRRPGL